MPPAESNSLHQTADNSENASFLHFSMFTPINIGLESPVTGNNDGFYDLLYDEGSGCNKIAYINLKNMMNLFLSLDISVPRDNPSNQSCFSSGIHSLFWLDGALFAVLPDKISGKTQLIHMNADENEKEEAVTFRADQTLNRGIAYDGKKYIQYLSL